MFGQMQGFHAFTLFQIPVVISPWFLILAGWLGWQQHDLRYTLIWIVVLAVSILVHEFGHALVARAYRLAPKVMLHGWGGLCAHDRAERDRDDALIVISGPAAGLLLGGLVWILARFIPGLHGNLYAMYTINILLYVNIFWSLVNLIPLWPLDGGQLFRLGLLQVFGPGKAERITHITGLVIGVIGGWYAFQVWHSTFVAIMAGYMAYENLKALQSGRASGAIRPKNRFAQDLLTQAKAALAAEDWKTAARLGHQIRSLQSLTDATMLATWDILARSTAHQDEPERALSYARRARPSAIIVAIRIDSLITLGRTVEARNELKAEGKRLTAKDRARFESLMV